MRLSSFVSSDAILHLPESTLEQKQRAPGVPHLFFLLTGNPGLIGYYEKYLELIARPGSTSANDFSSQTQDENVNTDQALHSKPQYVVSGFSLGGFELDNDQHHSQHHATIPATADHPLQEDTTSHDEMIQDLQFPPGHMKKDIYSLHDQIELSYARLRHLCQRLREHYSDLSTDGDAETRSKPVKVILAGHSVGAYIALEMIRLHHERFVQDRQSSTASLAASASGTEHTLHIDIVSALLLTPTIIDLAKSSSGRVAGPLLSNVPFFPALLQWFSSGLGLFFSRTYIEWIVHKVTGMRMDGPGLRTTVDFLVSKGGVQQALHMAADELRDMGSNKWGEEVWGATTLMTTTRPANELREMAGTGWRAPKLFFLFAEKDHWVADITRDHIVASVSGEEGKRPAGGAKADEDLDLPIVIIDQESKLVHAWCLEQSEFVACISKQWIATLLASQ